MMSSYSLRAMEPDSIAIWHCAVEGVESGGR